MLPVILSLLILQVSANIVTITLDTPGSYQLTPEDYQYSPQIIVEMWGAGGGGCSGNCGIGGGSGAYIKATINTNLETFNLTIGVGGKGGDGVQIVCYTFGGCSYPWYVNSINYSGYSGTDTVISSNRNHLIAGGGMEGNVTVRNCYSYPYQSCYDNSGKYIIDRIDGYVNKSLNGNSGTLGFNKINYGGCIQMPDYCSNCLMVAGNGGDSPYGSSGGIGSNSTGCSSTWPQESGCIHNTNVNYWIPYSINGSIGSGGGGTFTDGCVFSSSCQYMQNGCYYTTFQQAGYGGNGTIVVYYETQSVIYEPDPSPSPTSSLLIRNSFDSTRTISSIITNDSVSNTRTMTSNVTNNSASQTKTLIENYDSSVNIIDEFYLLWFMLGAVIIFLMLVIFALCISFIRKDINIVQSININNLAN